MRFHSAIISGILLSSTVLADRLHEHLQSRFLDTRAATTVNGTSWAGAGWEEGLFTQIAGTFIVPTITSESGAASAVWAAIDSSGCSSYLVAAVLIQVGDQGTSYQAMYNWYPGNQVNFPDLSITPGDTVQLIVTVDSSNEGFVRIENLTKSKSAQQSVQSTNSLCQQGAEVGVLDFQGDNGEFPFAHFGSLIFTDVVATGPNGLYVASEATTIYEVERNGQVLTSVFVEGNSLIISQE